MNPVRLFAFKARLELYGEILASGDGLVPFNQESLLEVADELLAEIDATFPNTEMAKVRIGGCCWNRQESFQEAVRLLHRDDRWPPGSQKLLVFDCLEMLEIIESHRKPAPTPTQETPVTPPMTDERLESLRSGIREVHAAYSPSYLIPREIVRLFEVAYALLAEVAYALLAEVERLHALPPASEVEVAVTALGNMLQEHLSDVTESVKDCLELASAACDAIEAGDSEARAHALFEKALGGDLDAIKEVIDRTDPKPRLVDAPVVDARLQEILDAMYEQEDNSDGAVHAAFEGILRLQGWVDGKTEPATV